MPRVIFERRSERISEPDERPSQNAFYCCQQSTAKAPPPLAKRCSRLHWSQDCEKPWMKTNRTIPWVSGLHDVELDAPPRVILDYGLATREGDFGVNRPCQGPMTIISFLEYPAIVWILLHLNLWEVPERSPPPAAPARDSIYDPDFFRGLVN